VSVDSSTAILIVGPTGTGKSLLALELALKLNCSIINADSIQVYKDLVIGSAQPSREDFKIAPHHLYGYLPAGSSLTAAAYSEDVRGLLKNKLHSGPIIICGGSGFYIQAIEKGMFDAPALTDELKEKFDATLMEWGWERAYKELLACDPEVKIHANDHYRIRRALEIFWATGKKPSEIGAHSETAPLKNKKLIKIGMDMDKEKLRERIAKRTDSMLSAGWIDEVEKMITAGHRDWSALQSVGYKEVLEYIEGHINKSEMIEKIITSNMQLIKKQRTWFKRDETIAWYTPETSALAVASLL
jgi:tRNA dimethylallyltransferase